MTSADQSTVPLTMCELTCPSCGARHTQTMPTDACIYYFECTACGTMLKPKPGDCCVFCSYGSLPCPPIQMARAGGDTGTSCCG
ncbi:MAG: GDCCVxC domain-containing (seleno)protein [Steroidobacteraceae bacterium]